HIDDAKESNVKKYLIHPLLHTLKILAYILAVNVVMGIIVYYVGEERIAEFMAKSGGLQPLLVTLVGLIPNCASSVIITQLFLADTISFGSCLGGLIVNAGLGIAFLFKANKNIKQNIAITVGLFVFAAIVALIFHYALGGLI
ncbi:MAG: arsenic efflux protein, partial [Clostridia bacterium]|nr:arsenic efflux protein [Clostridia bacterium]